MARAKRAATPPRKVKSKSTMQNVSKAKPAGSTIPKGFGFKTPRTKMLPTEQVLAIKTSGNRHKLSDSRSSKFKQRAAPSPAQHHFLANKHSGRMAELDRSLPPHERIEEASSSEEEEEEEEGHSEADSDEWDGGLTLVDNLMGFDEDEDDEAQRNQAVVMGLQAPFAALSADMKKDLIEVLAPTTEQLKDAHEQIKSHDDASALAIIAFSKEADAVQASAAEELATLQAAYSDSQGKLKQLFNRLKASYEARQERRSNLLEALKGIQSQMVEDLDALAKEFEHSAISLQNRAQTIAKSKPTKSDMDKYLKMMMAMD